MASTIALRHLEALLGDEATDDMIWRSLMRFYAAAHPVVAALWPLDQDTLHYPWRLLHPATEAELRVLDERRAQAVQRIQHTLGRETASCAAAFFLHPQLWEAGAGDQREYWRNPTRHVQAELLRQVAEACARQSPPADWVRSVSRRVVVLCLASVPGGEPDFERCIAILIESGGTQAAPLLDALCAGDWAAAARSLSGLAATAPSDRLAGALQQRWAACHTLTETLLRRMDAVDRLDLRAFRRLLATIPDGLRTLNYLLAQRMSAFDADQDAAQRSWDMRLLQLVDAALWDLVSDLRPEAWPTLGQIAYLSGGRYLLRIVEEIARLQLVALPRGATSERRLDAILLQLLHVLHRRADEDSAALIALLAQLPPRALLAAIPHCAAYEAELCAALGWPAAAALLQWMRRVESQQPAQSSDPRAGVVVRSELLQLAGALNEAQLRLLLDVCAGSMRDSVLLVRAALGWNVTEVRRMFGRNNRMAARALALLPMTKPDEVLQRYLALTRFQREAQAGSPSGKAYARGAAEAALTNLALVAGFADAVRLEWAMQAQLGAERTAIGRCWEIGGYTLTLALGDRGPALEICNAKRVLKRTPTVVTHDYAYREVRATLEQAQDQDRRTRQALLDAMQSAAPLQPDELALLRANPIAARQLARLVLLDAAGAHGLFCPEDATLEGTHGERVPISGAVQIAHPFALAANGVLRDWQAEIVRRQIVQPFKQIFRELYLLTPAEVASGCSSARLAGRRMRGRQALAVLANLGWVVDGGEVRKPFYALGFAAQIELVYDGDGDDDALRVGPLSFWPLVYHRDQHRALPLTEVPPVVFSEVVRDLDLVTAIAYQSMDGGASSEVLQRRGDLVLALIQALGLRQVRVEETAVVVGGQRTSYRIQLATGAAYLISGQHLCIVPKPAGQSPLYLPYAEGGDPVTTEIVSKVLLLANDHAIRDESILAQIALPARAA